MRISKIFHWLYASVLLMPIFAIGVKCMYVTFNKNAKESYYGETINESEYLNYNGSQLVVGKDYNLYTSLPENMTGNGNDLYITAQNVVINDVADDLIYRIQFWKGTTLSNTQFSILVFRTNNTTTEYYNYSLTSLKFTFTGYYLTNPSNIFNNYDMFYQIEYNDYSYIDNVFYYSVEQINNEPLFSWAKTSFLSQPLLFITNLFGLPSTSPIITFLSYWFDISIIWLVFDAIMYFPLLIHRWLDKGVIE